MKKAKIFAHRDEFNWPMTPAAKKLLAARKLVEKADKENMATINKAFAKALKDKTPRPSTILVHPDTYQIIKKTLDDAPKPKPMLHWMQRVQALIQKHESTPVRKSGKYKGHSSTDSPKWIAALTLEVQADIRRCNKGIGYDENMALASRVGHVLSVWYFLVHRAKSYDPNRPIRARQEALEKRDRSLAALFADAQSDLLMTQAFPDQWWNLPYGKNKVDGSFV